MTEREQRVWDAAFGAAYVVKRISWLNTLGLRDENREHAHELAGKDARFLASKAVEALRRTEASDG